jgi:hypothetical protein
MLGFFCAPASADWVLTPYHLIPLKGSRSALYSESLGNPRCQPQLRKELPI